MTNYKIIKVHKKPFNVCWNIEFKKIANVSIGRLDLGESKVSFFLAKLLLNGVNKLSKKITTKIGY